MFHETEAKHAHSCALSSTASKAKPINLERQGHRSGRSARPDGLYFKAQGRKPTGPEKIKAVANPVFHPSLPPKSKPHEHRPGDDFAQKVRLLYSRRCCPRGGLARRQPTQEMPKAIAYRCQQNESAAGRGAPGRTRAVARLLGSQRVLLDSARYSNLEHKRGHILRWET